MKCNVLEVTKAWLLVVANIDDQVFFSEGWLGLEGAPQKEHWKYNVTFIYQTCLSNDISENLLSFNVHKK